MNRSKHIAGLLSVLVLAAATTGAPAQKSNRPGPSALSETYDTWTVQCANRTEGETTTQVCQMSQQLLQQETGQRVMTFAIGRVGQENKATLILPFGLRLSDGARIQVGEEDVASGSFSTCLPDGCFVELTLSDSVIKKLQGAANATLMMTANTGQPVKIDVSLQGFSAAYQRLVALTGE
jgi:invasion protein IalB